MIDRCMEERKRKIRTAREDEGETNEKVKNKIKFRINSNDPKEKIARGQGRDGEWAKLRV